MEDIALKRSWKMVGVIVMLALPYAVWGAFNLEYHRTEYSQWGILLADFLFTAYVLIKWWVLEGKP